MHLAEGRWEGRCPLTGLTFQEFLTRRRFHGLLAPGFVLLCTHGLDRSVAAQRPPGPGQRGRGARRARGGADSRAAAPPSTAGARRWAEGLVNNIEQRP